MQLIDYNGLPEQHLPVEGEVETLVAEPRADYRHARNIYRLVNQLPIEGTEKRIPDAILYINGLPLVVFEFKSAVREDATIHDAYVQLTTRYVHDIPELMKYNALCVISDGVNSRMGSLFAPYEFFYTWRKVTGHESIEQDVINALHTMIAGLFHPDRLWAVLRHEEIIDLIQALKKEKASFADLGIDLAEKAFYDILKKLANKYDFSYPEDKLLELAKAVKVDDKASTPTGTSATTSKPS